MDSASGSLQSSSGGDEEYDSHQPFLNNIHPSASIARPSFHLPHNFQTLHPAFFDFPSHYQTFNQDSSLVNLDMIRPTTVRSEPNRTDFRNLDTVGSASPLETLRPAAHDTSDPRNLGLHPKSTKKRTRASRRAPTTILTTDTSNFRAMVQEFTGIPAPPFSAAGSSYSRRFDLFGSASSALRTTATHLEASGSALYSLRPKVQLLSSPSMAPSLSKELQTTSNMQQEGFLSFPPLSGLGNNLEQHHNDGSSQLLPSLQNEGHSMNNVGNIQCKLNSTSS